MADATSMPPETNSQHPDIIVRLQGAGGAELLHGQTTADFKNPGAGDVRYAAFCDPKGRVLADVRAVVVSDTEILLRGRAAVIENLSAHLKPFLMFARATMTPTDWCISAEAAERGASVATLEYEADMLSAVFIPGEEGFSERWAPPSHTEPNPAQPDLSYFELQGARARIETETIGAFLPQDLNFDLNGTVSFSKGCYTGQEIIARLHYRGTPKRRLHRASADQVARPGQALRNAEGQAVGSVVNVTHHQTRHQMLVELKPDAVASAIYLDNTDSTLNAIARCHDHGGTS
jgi:folate-binding protein YgfZ